MVTPNKGTNNSTLENKIRLFADLDIEPKTPGLGAALGIPEVDKRQPDLQYFSSVFVSSGYNLNSAFFLPTELIKAESSVVDKPLDIEHEQDKIVGHLYSKVFALKDRTVFDPAELAASAGEGINNVSMDIITASRVYKARFPEVAADILMGKYKVSMECYFRDFDIIVDNLIIPKAEAKQVGLTEEINKIITVKDGNKALGRQRVGRVLRDILFSGCGLVENPANPDSVILETAAVNNDKYILDLTRIESYMKMKQKKESITIHSLKGLEQDKAYMSASYGGSHAHECSSDKSETFEDGGHSHMVDPDSMPEDKYVYFLRDGNHRHGFDSNGGKFNPESGHTHKAYIEDRYGNYTAVETSAPKKKHSHEMTMIDDTEEGSRSATAACMCGCGYGGVHSHELVLPDGTKCSTLTPMDVLKKHNMMLDDEAKMSIASSASKTDTAGNHFVDGTPLSTPDICVSYKRFVYEVGGDDPGVPANADKTPGLVKQVESLPLSSQPGGPDTVKPTDKIKAENWCAAFDSACTTPGGVAVHPDCLRLVLDRTTKEAVTDFLDKLNENRSEAIRKSLASLNMMIDKASCHCKG